MAMNCPPAHRCRESWRYWGGSTRTCASRCGKGRGVSGHFIGQELQGHEAMQPGVLGFIDRTHPATAELFNDAVL